MTDIHLARDFHLPISAVTQTFGIMGKKRSGKSHTATVMAEGMLTAGAQIVVLDPVGVWWGLRLGRDGKSKGFGDVLVLGGRHGDLPLEPKAGKLVADLVVDRGVPAVLDVSPWTWEKRKTFVYDFIDRLYHQIQAAPRPVHVFLEEAQVFIPQNASNRGELPMVGRINEMVRIGGNYGIGVSMISQRPASVSKESLTQVEALICHQIVHNLDRKAIREWVVAMGVEDDWLDELPSLPKGTAFFWSPEWVETFEKIHVLQKKTYDSSSTPEFGSERIEPRPLERADLEELQGAMAQVVEEAEANDPRALKARVAQLERELAAARRQSEAPSAPDGEALEVARQAGAAEAVRQVIGRMDARDGDIGPALDDALSLLGRAVGCVEKARDAVRTPLDVELPAAPRRRTEARPAPARIAPSAGSPRRERAEGAAGASLTGGARRMIEALYRMHPGGLSEAAWATQARLKRSGGTWSTYKSRIRDLVEERGGLYYLSDEGIDAMGGAPPEPLSQEELHGMWRAKFTGGARRMLDLLLEAYPDGYTREGIAEAAGVTLSGGTFSTYLSRLRSCELVEDQDGVLFASGALFP